MAQVLTAPRDDLHSVTDWKAGAWAGLIAGLVFVMLEMGMVWIFQSESPWGPPHMIAAMALGKEVLPSPGTPAPFDLKIMMTAMMIHLPMSIAYGLIGAGLGLAIYIVNFYGIAPAAFPWFVMGRNWIGAFSHIMFGAVVGVAYIALRKPKLTGR